MHNYKPQFFGLFFAGCFAIPAHAALNTLIFDVHLTSCEGGKCNKDFKQTYSFSDALGPNKSLPNTGEKPNYYYAFFQNVQGTDTPNFPDIAKQFAFTATTAQGVVGSGNSTSPTGPQNLIVGFNTGASSLKDGVASTYSSNIVGSFPITSPAPVTYQAALASLLAFRSFSFSELSSSVIYTTAGSHISSQYVQNYGTAVLSSFNGVSVMASVPEPEIYAMLLAGLGLMGYVAKRRKLTKTIKPV